jgi:hypothetical protein
VLDINDNCQEVPNGDQSDIDGDGKGQMNKRNYPTLQLDTNKSKRTMLLLLIDISTSHSCVFNNEHNS